MTGGTILTYYGRVLAVLAKSIVTTVIFFTCSEVALRAVFLARSAMVRFVPLPYALGDDYGPMPPWLDRLEILVPDDTLIWRSLPNAHRTYVDIFTPVRTEHDRLALLRRFTPTLPEEFRRNPTWHVDLSSEGHRTAEYTATKRAGSIRIACIGDSWTFGMNVDQDRTYPSRLLARLRDAQPHSNVEVMNFGVLGYSSFQGVQLLKSRVLALAPDVLVIGFGMNDSEVAGYRDKDMVATVRPGVAARLKDTGKDLEFYKLLQYLALSIRFHRKPVGEYIRAEAESKSGAIDYETIEPWTRVSPHDYEANIREMIRLQTAQDGKTILIDNELWDESPYRPILRRIAADTRAPLIDSLRIVADGKEHIERSLEQRFNLASHEPATSRVPGQRERPDLPDRPGLPDQPDPRGLPGPSVTVIFRVFHGNVPVQSAMSIVGTVPQLGDLVPNAIQMHDDGRDGDERAADGVWSYAASLPAGQRVFYVYTNSGTRGVWEGLDVPSIRHLTVPTTAGAGPVYLPIDTFGQLYMQADNWHTDAEGYDLIADAVAKAVKSRARPTMER
jgi:lysophospholipase L1-like esterase